MLNSPLCVFCSGVSSSSCRVCGPAAGCSPGLKAVCGGDCSCRAPGSGHWGPWQVFSCAGALPGCLGSLEASALGSSGEGTAQQNA